MTPPSGDMTIDGVCGPTTIRWILGFQNEVVKRGLSIYPDGRVDRAGGKVSTISETTYAILHLNHGFMKLYPDIWATLSTNQDVPVEVRTELGGT